MNKYIIASTFFTLITSSAAYASTPYSELRWGDGWKSSGGYAATTEVDQEVGGAAIMMTKEEFAAQNGTIKVDQNVGGAAIMVPQKGYVAQGGTIEVDQEVGDSAIMVTKEEYAAQAGTSCRKKRIIKTDDSVCDLLKKPGDINPATLPGAAQNPFTSGCDFSAFNFPGLPSFGGDSGAMGGLIDKGLGAMGEFGSAVKGGLGALKGASDTMGGGFAQNALCDLTQGLVNPLINDVNNDMKGNVELMLFDVTGKAMTASGGGGDASSPNNYLDTVNQIKNVLKAVK
jgi:hypothetical protein